MEFDCGDGMLVITSTQELVVSASWRNSLAPADTELLDITPQADSLCAYMIDPAHSVEYLIEHIQQQPTPLKLAFRTMLPPDELPEIGRDGPNTRPVVAWSFIAADGSVVAQGSLDIEQAVSSYDRLSSMRAFMQVTDPAVYYFAVPTGVQRVRLESAEDGVLVGAYSRPPDVANVTVVPDDYSAFHRQEGERRRWFMLRPTEHIARINEFRTATVVIQPRPADVDPQLVAGNYQWESFQPRGPSNGRFLLVAREAQPDLTRRPACACV
jgi:hypothetical protein